MNCDIESGICEIAPDNNQAGNHPSKPIRLLYFTDPICSSCWGIEPQLRKLKLEYGAYFEMEYRMGGLLKGWDAYGGNDVSGPADVAKHWDEASEQYGMPIDGDLWIEDPLDSSYPPSIAFKAAQLQDKGKAENFLRRIKEMVFLEKKNITRWEHLVQAALDSRLDVVQFRDDFHNRATEDFQQDLQMAKEWGVRGFPTIFFIDADDNRFKVYGSKPYETYQEALLKLLPDAVRRPVPASYETVLDWHKTMTTKEFATLNNRNLHEAEIILAYMAGQCQIEKLDSKNGPLWKKLVSA